MTTQNTQKRGASVLLLSAVALLVLCQPVKVLAAELLMIEEDGCYWCEAWNDDIAHIYPKTSEGEAAPLRRINIDAEIGNRIELQRSVHFTPTFVLVDDGKEVGRIEGYPGEDFFWGLLGQMIERLPQDVSANTDTSG